MKKLHAQSTADYVVVLCVLMILLLTIAPYVRRAFSGKLKESADSFGGGEVYQNDSKLPASELTQIALNRASNSMTPPPKPGSGLPAADDVFTYADPATEAAAIPNNALLNTEKYNVYGQDPDALAQDSITYTIRCIDDMVWTWNKHYTVGRCPFCIKFTTGGFISETVNCCNLNRDVDRCSVTKTDTIKDKSLGTCEQNTKDGVAIVACILTAGLVCVDWNRWDSAICRAQCLTNAQRSGKFIWGCKDDNWIFEDEDVENCCFGEADKCRVQMGASTYEVDNNCFCRLRCRKYLSHWSGPVLIEDWRDYICGKKQDCGPTK